jgi:hypothetical protein
VFIHLFIYLFIQQHKTKQKNTKQQNKMEINTENESIHVNDMVIPSYSLDSNSLFGKKIMLCGPRSCGKTTVIKNILQQLDEDSNKCVVFIPETRMFHYSDVQHHAAVIHTNTNTLNILNIVKTLTKQDILVLDDCIFDNYLCYLLYLARCTVIIAHPFPYGMKLKIDGQSILDIIFCFYDPMFPNHLKMYSSFGVGTGVGNGVGINACFRNKKTFMDIWLACTDGKCHQSMIIDIGRSRDPRFKNNCIFYYKHNNTIKIETTETIE